MFGLALLKAIAIEYIPKALGWIYGYIKGKIKKVHNRK